MLIIRYFCNVYFLSSWEDNTVLLRIDSELHWAGHVPLQHGDAALLRHRQHHVRLTLQHRQGQRQKKSQTFYMSIDFYKDFKKK